MWLYPADDGTLKRENSRFTQEAKAVHTPLQSFPVHCCWFLILQFLWHNRSRQKCDLFLIFCLNLLDDSYVTSAHTDRIKQKYLFSRVKVTFIRLWLVTSLRRSVVFGDETHYPVISLLYLIQTIILFRKVPYNHIQRLHKRTILILTLKVLLPINAAKTKRDEMELNATSKQDYTFAQIKWRKDAALTFHCSSPGAHHTLHRPSSLAWKVLYLQTAPMLFFIGGFIKQQQQR